MDQETTGNWAQEGESKEIRTVRSDLNMLLNQIEEKKSEYEVTKEKMWEKALAISYFSMLGLFVEEGYLDDEEEYKHFQKFINVWKKKIEVATGLSMQKLIDDHLGEKGIMADKSSYVKIIEGDNKGKVLRFTGTTKSTVTVEYIEVCFSVEKKDCLPWVDGETTSWEDYELGKEKCDTK